MAPEHHDRAPGQAGLMARLARDWRALEPEQRLAAVAALALLVTMFLPWYELQSLDRKTGVIYSHSISAFGDVSFVEAAVFLVAAGVLAMLFARAERRQFHLPGGDGTIAMIAGGWAALLIFYRVFSRPAGHGYPVGIEWGFFLAFVAAGALTYAGWRMRATSRPEPPLMRSAPPEPQGKRGRPRRPLPPPASYARTNAPPAAPTPPMPRPARPPTPGARRRPVPASQSTEQLSFEDQPPEPEQRSA